jgi:hypothetical protein
LAAHAAKLCVDNANQILLAVFDHHATQYLEWRCCRCQPPNEGSKNTRKCYNKSCACFQFFDPSGNHIPCINCLCGEACCSTVDLIQKRLEDKKKEPIGGKDDSKEENKATSVDRKLRARESTKKPNKMETNKMESAVSENDDDDDDAR